MNVLKNAICLSSFSELEWPFTFAFWRDFDHLDGDFFRPFMDFLGEYSGGRGGYQVYFLSTEEDCYAVVVVGVVM